MATDAPTPSRSGLLQFAREIHESEADRKIDLDDRYLYELTSMPGWKILKRLVETYKQELKPHFNIEGNDDEFFKSYGMRSVVYDIVSDRLDSLVKRVEDAEEVVKENRK